MKKKYEKPQVYMEKFELSHNVAVCDYKLGAANQTDCSIVKDRYQDDGAEFVGGFVGKPTCSIGVSLYCYTSGTEGLPKLFQS